MPLRHATQFHELAIISRADDLGGHADEVPIAGEEVKSMAMRRADARCSLIYIA